MDSSVVEVKFEKTCAKTGRGKSPRTPNLEESVPCEKLEMN